MFLFQIGQRWDQPDKTILEEHIKKFTPEQKELFSELSKLPQLKELSNKMSNQYRSIDEFFGLFGRIESLYKQYKEENPSSTMQEFIEKVARPYIEIFNQILPEPSSKNQQKTAKALERASTALETLSVFGNTFLIEKLNNLLKKAQNPFNNLDKEKVEDFINKLTNSNPQTLKDSVKELIELNDKNLAEKFGRKE